ncbi:hypothetical protein GF412_02710 [Candidatus Micrarchaeota archaeon]|nr:hypothetical protein [Candidatus Micrarchaeota archaeon]
MAHAKIGGAKGAGKAPIRGRESGQDARPARMSPELRSISRICAVCNALELGGGDRLADGRKLLEILSSKLPASAGTPALPKSRAAMVEGAAEQAESLLNSSQEKLSRALGEDANERVYAALASLGLSLRQRIEAERYAEWMKSSSPTPQPPLNSQDTPEPLLEMGKGVRGGGVVGHGV